MGLLNKIHKRQCFPVKMEDGEIFYVRPMRNDEVRRASALDRTLQDAFIVGKAVVNEACQPEAVQESDETDAVFAERIITAMAEHDIDGLVVARVIAEVSKIMRYNPDSILKN